MNVRNFFLNPQIIAHKQYEALRAFYVEGRTAEEISEQFGYTKNSFYSLTRDFAAYLKTNDASNKFFVTNSAGRKPTTNKKEVDEIIIELRKKYLSVPDIKAIIDARGYKTSEKYIFNTIRKEGFTRLPRRGEEERIESLSAIKIKAPQSELLEYESEHFNTESSIGLLSLLPYICSYGIDKLIQSSEFPETKALPKINSILSFLALKLSNVQRYTSDDLWCMDRSLGLFAGLNVLPKASWFSSYSSRVTRKANILFLKELNKLWLKHGLLSDSANLDFVSIPYWGNDSHLENNWSGTRHKSLASVLAALSQDPDSGIITYGDTNVRHSTEKEVVLEFLDFYKECGGEQELNYLIFDSKMTTYQNLRKLDDNGVKFITIRRRGKNIVEHITGIESQDWKKVRVPIDGGKNRIVKVYDSIVNLKDYGKELRQIAITGHGKIKPALIITNELNASPSEILRKYARRWLVEKSISEQTHFFHLNKVSSSMVIKVDFDLTMTILAHNLYRLFAQDLMGYSHLAPHTLYKKFIHNGGDIDIKKDSIVVKMKKKRNLPAILTAMEHFQSIHIPFLHNLTLVFQGASRS